MPDKVPAWDFGAAKGTGASIVPYDPHADNTKGFRPTEPPKPPPRVVEKPLPSDGMIFAYHRISKLDALRLAYTLAATEQHRIIPHPVRLAMARQVRRVGGSRALQDRILNGELDDHLGSLLP